MQITLRRRPTDIPTARDPSPLDPSREAPSSPTAPPPGPAPEEAPSDVARRRPDAETSAVAQRRFAADTNVDQLRRRLESGLTPVASNDAAPVSDVDRPSPVPPAVLSRGARGDAVGALQDRLVDLGIMTAAERATGPGIFGPRTEQRVKDFQSSVSLSPSGVFDHATRAALSAVHGGVGLDRNPNPDVTRALHAQLLESGHLTQAQVDAEAGDFGETTEAALQAWQRDNGVAPTGILGATTFQALRGAGSAGSWPLPGFFTVNRADRPGEGDGEFGTFRNGGRRHNGIDINAPVGSSVESFRAGEVVFAGQMRGFGNTVIVQHEGGLQTVYAHLDRIDVRRGQRVTEDTQLATLGRSGNVPPAGDTHLHFEIREGANGVLTGTPVNPRRYLQFP